MDWGDVPSGIAAVMAVVAVILSGVALKHSKESVKAAKQSAESSERSARAAERSAAADEAALAEMQREAAERRAAEAEAARPKPDLKVTRESKVQYLLRNVGTGAAVNLTIAPAGEPGQCRNLPAGVTIPAGEAHQFQILAAMGLPRVTAVYATWDGQDDPVALPVPM